MNQPTTANPEASLGFIETFVEYGVSYRGEDPRRGTWSANYDEVMRDAAFRDRMHGTALGPITVVQRTTTLTSTAWEPAVRPATDVTDLHEPFEPARIAVTITPAPTTKDTAHV